LTSAQPAEFVKDARFEEDGAGDHDGHNQRPRTRPVPAHNRYLDARDGAAASHFGRQALAKRLWISSVHCGPIRYLQGKCRRFWPTSNGSDLLFRTMEWKLIRYGPAAERFLFAGASARHLGFTPRTPLDDFQLRAPSK